MAMLSVNMISEQTVTVSIIVLNSKFILIVRPNFKVLFRRPDFEEIFQTRREHFNTKLSS